MGVGGSWLVVYWVSLRAARQVGIAFRLVSYIYRVADYTGAMAIILTACCDKASAIIFFSRGIQMRVTSLS